MMTADANVMQDTACAEPQAQYTSLTGAKRASTSESQSPGIWGGAFAGACTTT